MPRIVRMQSHQFFIGKISHCAASPRNFSAGSSINLGKGHAIVVVLGIPDTDAILDFKLRIKYATVIVACWRRYRRFTLHFSKCKLMNEIACVFADSIKRNLYCQNHKVAERQHFRVAEAHLAGRSMFERTRETKIQHQILVQSNVCNRDHNAELQRIFVTYCAMVKRKIRVYCELGASTATKRLIKRNVAINAAGLRPRDVELMSMKNRNHSNAGAVDKHLRYRSFCRRFSLGIFFIFTFLQ